MCNSRHEEQINKSSHLFWAEQCVQRPKHQEKEKNITQQDFNGPTTVTLAPLWERKSLILSILVTETELSSLNVCPCFQIKHCDILISPIIQLFECFFGLNEANPSTRIHGIRSSCMEVVSGLCFLLFIFHAVRKMQTYDYIFIPICACGTCNSKTMGIHRSLHSSGFLLCTRCWKLAAEMCSHGPTRALVKSSCSSRRCCWMWWRSELCINQKTDLDCNK